MIAIAWILLAPCAVACLVATSGRFNRLVGSHLRIVFVLGWTGLAALIAGAFVPLLLVGAPLAGLAVWAPRPPDDDPGDPPRGQPPVPGEDVDWDAFMREVQRWTERPRSGTDLR